MVLLQWQAAYLASLLNNVLSNVVVKINYSKACALNTCLFEHFADDMAAEYKWLALHIFQWLFWGKALSHRCALLHGATKLSGNGSLLSDQVTDEDWIAKLSYLCDMFSHLGQFSLSLWGQMTVVFRLVREKSISLMQKPKKLGQFVTEPTSFVAVQAKQLELNRSRG